MLSTVSQNTFTKTVTASNYLWDLRLLITLFIIVSAIGFIMGVVQITQKEIMSMLFKLLVVVQLLANPDSWDFFNNYFFRFFTDGLQQMITIVTSGLTYGIAAGTGGMNFFDNVLAMFFGAEVTAKILSLISANFGVALFAIPIIYIAIIAFVFALIKAVIGYLIALIFMSLLIIIAPVFLTLLLFKMTRHFFDAWLKQLIRFFMEPLLIFAALGLMAAVIIDQLEKMLGFPVCWDPLIQFNMAGQEVRLLNFWNPHINLSNLGQIDLPGFQLITSTGVPITPALGYSSVPPVGELCLPYQCSAQRYYDLPFLDPNNDAELIQSYGRGGPGWHAIVSQAWIMLMLTYLMGKFNDTVPKIAQGLIGITASKIDIRAMAGGAMSKVGAAAAPAAKAAANKAASVVKKNLTNRANSVGNLLMKSKTLKGAADSANSLANKAYIAGAKGYDAAKKGFNSYQDGVGGQIDKMKPESFKTFEKMKEMNERGKNISISDMAGHAAFNKISHSMGGKDLNELQDNFGKSVLGGRSVHDHAQQLQQGLHNISGGQLPFSVDHKGADLKSYQQMLNQHATEMAHEHLKNAGKGQSDLSPSEFAKLVKDKESVLDAEFKKGKK
jgi:type IV secretory pathway VirB6-like protein